MKFMPAPNHGSTGRTGPLSLPPANPPPAGAPASNLIPHHWSQSQHQSCVIHTTMKDRQPDGASDEALRDAEGCRHRARRNREGIMRMKTMRGKWLDFGPHSAARILCYESRNSREMWTYKTYASTIRVDQEMRNRVSSHGQTLPPLQTLSQIVQHTQPSDTQARCKLAGPMLCKTGFRPFRH